MRVLHISQEVPPHTAWGGIGTYVGALAPAMVEHGAAFEVLSVVRDQARAVERPFCGMTVYRAPLDGLRGAGRLTGLVETWGRLSLSRAVAREYDRLRLAPEVVESPNWMAEGLVLARRRHVPVVVRLHSWASQILDHFGARRLDARLAARLEENLVRRADAVIGTEVQIGDARRRLGIPEERLHVIPPPVAPRTVTPIPEGDPLILFVGRLEARKGPETVVRALSAMPASPRVRLVLAGGDSSAPGIPSYAAWLGGLARELGVAEQVEIMAHRPDDGAVDTLRRQARVCVMPSRWESFGYVAAEGLAHGRPVVASDVGGLRAVVRQGVTGFLVAPDEVDAWADALTRLTRDPDLAARMGRLGADDVEARFGPSTVAEMTLLAYRAARAHFAGSGATPAERFRSIEYAP